ncbi:MAG: sulfotransferase [Gammaproteobacteria bacterium]
MRKPDFFIVGAPKCGPTALRHYLSQHPDIFLPEKEMHCFGSDLRFTRIHIII